MLGNQANSTLLRFRNKYLNVLSYSHRVNKLLMISWTWLIEKQMEVTALRVLSFVTLLLVELVQVG